MYVIEEERGCRVVGVSVRREKKNFVISKKTKIQKKTTNHAILKKQ